MLDLENIDLCLICEKGWGKLKGPEMSELPGIFSDKNMSILHNTTAKNTKALVGAGRTYIDI